MFEYQNEYYFPLLLCGVIFTLTASLFIYNKKIKLAQSNIYKSKLISPSNSNNNKSNPHIKVQLNSSSTTSSSQCLLSRRSSLSSLNTSSNNTPSSIHRKQDPLTRYDPDGTRYQCVSIPFRIIDNNVEILMITSRRKGDYIFPGGGWEKHETRAQCVQREAFEEGGIKGNVKQELISDQHYISDKGNNSKMWGYLLEVTELLDDWPETERKRKWMSIDEVESTLQPRRRKKFGNLWKNAKIYFTQQNLYKNNRMYE